MTHSDPTSQDSSFEHRDGVQAARGGRAGDPIGADADLPLDQLPQDLEELDRSLADLLAPAGRGDRDAAMVDRILTATTPDLPARVLAIHHSGDANQLDMGPRRSRMRIPSRWVAGVGAVAAAVAVAVFATRMLPTPMQERTGPTGTGGGLVDLADASAIDAEADPLEAIRRLPTRESEVMLVAVLDPAEDWFEDDPLVEFDAESVLRSRAFGLDELEGSVFAMLGGPTS